MVFLGERLTLAGAIGSTAILVGVIWAGRKNHWGEGDNDLPGIFLSLLPEDNYFFPSLYSTPNSRARNLDKNGYL